MENVENIENLQQDVEMQQEETPTENQEVVSDGEAPKQYSQNEVDELIKQSLVEEQQKNAENSKTEQAELKKQYNQLEQDKLKFKYEKKLFNDGLPEEMSEFLDYSTSEKCEESYQKMMKLIGQIVNNQMAKVSYGGIMKKAPDDSEADEDSTIKKAFGL